MKSQDWNLIVDEFVLRKPPTSTNRNSFQRAGRNRFNINQLRTSNFTSFQYGLASGSGPGALPGAPPGTPLNSTAEIVRVLNSVETRGYYSYRFDYSYRFGAHGWLQFPFNLKNLQGSRPGRPSGFASGVWLVDLLHYPLFSTWRNFQSCPIKIKNSETS